MWVFKQCTKCKEDKLLSEFKKDNKYTFGVDNHCRSCKSEYYRLHKMKNADSYRNRNIVHSERTKKKMSEDETFRKNKTKYNCNYARSRRGSDIKFRTIGNLRGLIRSAFKRRGYKKNSKTFDILGCDYDTFVSHIESKFQEGMTLENHGEWHIDHIYPVSLATDIYHLTKLNHYTNLQPLWKKENLSKGNKI
jgi:hypothetical protein